MTRLSIHRNAVLGAIGTFYRDDIDKSVQGQRRFIGRIYRQKFFAHKIPKGVGAFGRPVGLRFGLFSSDSHDIEPYLTESSQTEASYRPPSLILATYL